MRTQQRPRGCLAIRPSCSPGRPGTPSSLRDLRRHPGDLGSTKGGQGDEDPTLLQMTSPPHVCRGHGGAGCSHDNHGSALRADLELSPNPPPSPPGLRPLTSAAALSPGRQVVSALTYTAPEGKQSLVPEPEMHCPKGRGTWRPGHPAPEAARADASSPRSRPRDPGLTEEPAPSPPATPCPPGWAGALRCLASAHAPSPGTRPPPCAGREGEATEGT